MPPTATLCAEPTAKPAGSPPQSSRRLACSAAPHHHHARAAYSTRDGKPKTRAGLRLASSRRNYIIIKHPQLIETDHKRDSSPSHCSARHASPAHSRCGCGRAWRLTSRRWLALDRGPNGGLRSLSRPCPRLSVRWRSTAVISRSRHEPIAAAEHPPPPSSSSPPQPSQVRDLTPSHGTWRLAQPSLAASSSSHSRSAGSRKLPCSGWAI